MGFGSNLGLGFAKIRPTNWGNSGHACASPLVVRASEKRENLTQQKTGLSVEECEAAVVAGNAPSAPPVPPRPKAPAGTPVISPLVSSSLSLPLNFVAGFPNL